MKPLAEFRKLLELEFLAADKKQGQIHEAFDIPFFYREDKDSPVDIGRHSNNFLMIASELYFISIEMPPKQEFLIEIFKKNCIIRGRSVFHDKIKINNVNFIAKKILDITKLNIDILGMCQYLSNGLSSDITAQMSEKIAKNICDLIFKDFRKRYSIIHNERIEEIKYEKLFPNQKKKLMGEISTRYMRCNKELKGYLVELFEIYNIPKEMTEYPQVSWRLEELLHCLF
jgi:hypothetical protein